MGEIYICALFRNDYVVLLSSLAEKKVLSKKERRQMRKKQRENYPIIERSKGKWEALRRCVSGRGLRSEYENVCYIRMYIYGMGDG